MNGFEIIVIGMLSFIIGAVLIIAAALGRIEKELKREKKCVSEK